MQTEINLPFITANASGLIYINTKLLRSQFEALVYPLLQHTIEPRKKALADAGVKSSSLLLPLVLSALLSYCYGCHIIVFIAAFAATSCHRVVYLYEKKNISRLKKD